MTKTQRKCRVGNRKKKIEYEWRPMYCQSCLKIGHDCAIKKGPGKKLLQEKVWKPTKQNEATQNEEEPMNVVIKSAEQQEEPQKKQEEPQKKQEEPQREQDEPHKETQNEWTVVTLGEVDRGKRAMIHTPKSSFGPYQNSIIFTPLRIGDCPKGNNTT